jgi:hypothetical protein
MIFVFAYLILLGLVLGVGKQLYPDTWKDTEDRAVIIIAAALWPLSLPIMTGLTLASAIAKKLAKKP